MCKEIVRNPESCGKLTFLVSLKQPGSRDGVIQCFIKRDKSNLTYHFYLCLTPGLTLWKMVISNLIFLLNTIEATIEMDLDEFLMSSSHSILMYIMVYKNIDGDQDSMDELDAALSELTSDPHYPQNYGYIISDAVVRRIFNDLVDRMYNLENAGEGLNLPMLRSVCYWIFFALGHKGSGASSSDAIDVHMIWYLVRSSWLLHVSCNKRRVAPIAALLSSVVHDSVFGNMDIHELDNTQDFEADDVAFGSFLMVVACQL
ncbi:tRNA/rRNA methyltransferase, SpoU family protein [Tanacetum coccineum]